MDFKQLLETTKTDREKKLKDREDRMKILKEHLTFDFAAIKRIQGLKAEGEELVIAQIKVGLEWGIPGITEAHVRDLVDGIPPDVLSDLMLEKKSKTSTGDG